jgi:hypothetical protein
MADVQMKSPALMNDQIVTRRVTAKVKVTGNPTAASKVVESDLPGHVAVLASGIAVTGIDASATGISAQDTADAVVGVLLYDLVQPDNMLELSHVNVEFIDDAGATGAVAVVRKGDRGLTASGNIWLQVTLTGGGKLTATGDVLDMGVDVVYKVRL